MQFRTNSGRLVPAVTADQMREVDRLAVDVFQLGVPQMMENAGRSLAENAIDMLRELPERAVVLAGGGGNSGGALCCARHLRNHGADRTELSITIWAKSLGPSHRSSPLNVPRSGGKWARFCQIHR